MLTKKQNELLKFIYEKQREYGMSPSFDEMKDALGLKSKSGIHRMIIALEERGFVKKLPNKARALEIIKLPKNNEASNDSKNDDSISIPFVGKVAAGIPIQALEDISNSIEVPPSMIGNGEYYALQVEGDSMINAGILNNDTAIIKKTEIIDSGDIAVALIDDSEATLKRIRKKKKSLALESANPAYETKIYSPENIKIQGKLVGLLRRY